jgi:hypothetical protein
VSAPITDARDFNRDRRIDARDLAIVRSAYGSTLGTAPAEPALVTVLQATGTTRSRIARRSGLAELLR